MTAPSSASVRRPLTFVRVTIDAVVDVGQDVVELLDLDAFNLRVGVDVVDVDILHLQVQPARLTVEADVTSPSQASVREPMQLQGPDQAFIAGYVAGLLRQDPGRLLWTVEGLRDALGNYLDAVRITAPSGTYLVSIEKET